jgi:hypothetical protein
MNRTLRSTSLRARRQLLAKEVTVEQGPQGGCPDAEADLLKEMAARQIP